MWRVTKHSYKWYAVEFDMDRKLPEEEIENIQELLDGDELVILARKLDTIWDAIDLGDEEDIQVIDPNE